MPTTPATHEVFHAFAYAVNPQRTVRPPDVRTGPLGGAITIDGALRGALAAALTEARKERPTTVSLVVDTNPASSTSRTNPTLSDVLAVGFDDPSIAKLGAERLAMRLSEAMDGRSPSCLFLAAASKEGEDETGREVAIWIFPRDDAFRFESTAARIELVSDVFSRTSRQRKLALFRGARRSDRRFLRADVLDYQTSGEPGKVADFWVRDFLMAVPSVNTVGGTALVADILRRTAAELTDEASKEQIHATVLALRNQPTRLRSVEQIGREMLEGPARKTYERVAAKKAPTDYARSTKFQLDREDFAAKVNYRIFRLETDVWVSSPLEEVGASVIIEQDVGETSNNGRLLTARGRIVDDRMRRTHA